MVDEWIAKDIRQHYHVWDERSLKDLLTLAAKQMKADLELMDGFFLVNGFELLAVVRKRSNGTGRLKWSPSKTAAVLTLARVVTEDIKRHRELDLKA